MLNRGLFITFEGGDWCGKTTQLELLVENLQKAQIKVLSTREPGGTKLGQQLRQLVMHGEDLDPRTEALLYASDRAHHVNSLIRPALMAGKTVVSDRYWDSSITYQGGGRNLGEDQIRELSQWATDNLVPDLTILLDGEPVRLRTTRSTTQWDRIESAGLDFHNRVRETFLRLAAAEPKRFRVIDAEQSKEQISQQIWTEVVACYKRLDPTFSLPDLTVSEQIRG